MSETEEKLKPLFDQHGEIFTELFMYRGWEYYDNLYRDSLNIFLADKKDVFRKALLDYVALQAQLRQFIDIINKEQGLVPNDDEDQG